MDGSLSVCSGGSDPGSSYEATKRVSMAGIGSTAGSNDEELTVGGRAELQRWDGAALDFWGNRGGDTVWGGAGRVKKAMGGILGVRTTGIAA